MLSSNRRILDRLDGVRFLFIVQVIEKVQKKARVSFCRQMKAFHYEIVLRGIQPSLISSRQSAWPVLNSTKAATFWSILRFMLTLWSTKFRL